MGEISRFFKIIIRMFINEHNPPHFHAYYGDYKATFSIKTGQMIEGRLPPKKAALVTAWAIIHEKELLANWKALAEGKQANKIKSLEG